MALLDLQGMESAVTANGGHGGGGTSNLSALLCGNANSVLSVTLCK